MDHHACSTDAVQLFKNPFTRIMLEANNNIDSYTISYTDVARIWNNLLAVGALRSPRHECNWASQHMLLLWCNAHVFIDNDVCPVVNNKTVEVPSTISGMCVSNKLSLIFHNWVILNT